MARFPKSSWREWQKQRPKCVAEQTKHGLYNSRPYPYRGQHKRHLEAEIEAMGWNDDPTDAESKIAKLVRVIVNEIISNWHNAETAFHILSIAMRILKYQLIAPLIGNDTEFLPPDERGNQRNWRNPACKRFKDKNEIKHYVFNSRITVWPDGSRFIEPDGMPGMPVFNFPINPPSQHFVLRETLADAGKGEIVYEMFNGNLYHFPPPESKECKGRTFTDNRQNGLAM